MVEHSLWHVSSAVIATRFEYTKVVLAQLEAVEGLEVHGHDRGKIVVVIEGPSTGFLGEALSRVSLMDGVIAASMVFEQVTEEKHVEDRIADPA
ncbi:chaperone NapD [Rhizobium sp. Root1220]|uniref:chaperone NapD n=1 Tax=Rhizobium sp. Root1220 TaxID=1736432 RepID=UPI0006FD0F4A|nr:chaperone NapD [Rhizobium sp. Root1220]KQV81425.1 glutamate synthase [Rhizobium sp. Root1220]